jgi:hypothetical protein
MEVNDISALARPCPKYIELPRAKLVSGLDERAKERLLEIFIADLPALKEKLFQGGEKTAKVLVLTEPLGDFANRKRIFSEAIDQYGQHNDKPAQVIIKPHPADLFDYQQAFPAHIVLDGKFPMEMLNFISGLRFKRVVAIFTVPHGIEFADEIISLAHDYEKFRPS